MYETFTVERFRGISRAHLSNLKPITVLVGQNGIGKSTLLEALWIHSGGSAGRFFGIDNFRSGSARVISATGETLPPWRTLFYNLDTSEPLLFRGRDTMLDMSWTLTVQHEVPASFQSPLDKPLPAAQPERQSVGVASPVQALALKLETSRDGSQNARVSIDTRSGLVSTAEFPNYPRVKAYLVTPMNRTPQSLSLMFSDLVLYNRDKEIVQALQSVNPRVDHLGLTVSTGALNTGQTLELVADIGLRELLPISLLGGGLQAIASYVMAALLSQGGCLLIDELESGLHFSHLDDVWKVLDHISQDYDVQIVVATHSVECIEALRQTVAPERVALIGLAQREGEDELNVVSWTGEQLAAAKELRIEVR